MIHHASISSGQQCADCLTEAISWYQSRGERGAPAPTRRHSDGSDDRPLSVTKQARTRETSDRGRNTRSPGPSLFDDFLQPLKTINTNSRYYWGVNQQLEKWVALKRCRETKQSYTRYCFYTSMKKSCCI